MTRSIVLTGFMGSGKTSVGRLAAQRLGRPFVDMDVEIERRLGKPIARIFAEDGEAVFRHAERMLCAELAEREGLIIAAGGGALVDPANYAALAEKTDLICLYCSVEELLNRMENCHDRPLLEVADRRAEIERLLQERQAMYDIIPWKIDTTHLTLEESVQQVAAVALRRSLPVRCFTERYAIHIAPGILDHSGTLLRMEKVRLSSVLALVANPLVGGLYGGRVTQSLERMGYQTLQCQIPDGEQYKTLQTVASLYDQFAAGGMDRCSHVLALGGGVTGDIAGMAAGTYLRGVGLIQIPTTLLAMVDSSVGGKTGVDLPQGKNLAGVFKQPLTVLIDPLTLQTLAEVELRCGMAELIKHAVIGDEALFAEVESAAAQPLKDLFAPGAPSWGWIERALQVKIRIVEEDPFEEGRRALLNLGHTLGHALEKVSGYALRHGEAVSIGMAAEARLAQKLGLAEAHLARRLEETLMRCGLPVRCPPYALDAALEAARQDKKRRQNRLRWALPRRVGQAEIVEDVPLEAVKEVLLEAGACL